MVGPKKPARTTPDVFDASIVLGYALVVVGIWRWSPPAALIVAGMGLVSFGLYGSWRQGKGVG